MPVLTVEAGRSEAGQLAAASHTAAVATPLVTREALFAQAGIIAVPGLGDLIEATALLARAIGLKTLMGLKTLAVSVTS
jgi:acyl-CoA synthetase (NDP forming)